jgi:hypothetical protein
LSLGIHVNLEKQHWLFLSFVYFNLPDASVWDLKCICRDYGVVSFRAFKTDFKGTVLTPLESPELGRTWVGLKLVFMLGQKYRSFPHDMTNSFH